MSAEIVLSPEAFALGLIALPVAIPVAIGVAIVGVQEKRLAEKRKEQERQLAALASRLDVLAKKQAQGVAPACLADDFLQKNRQSILENLDDVLTVENGGKLNVSQYSMPDSPREPDGSDPSVLKEKIRQVFTSLSLIDAKKAELCRNNFEESQNKCSPFRANLIFDDLKIHYANSLHALALTLWRQKKIEEMAATLSGDRAKEFANASRYLKSGCSIFEKDFETLVSTYEKLLNDELNEKRNQLLVEQTIAKMRKLGYSPAGSNSDGVVFFNTPDREYRIMARVNPANGQLSLRFVAVVGSEREKAGRSTAQKRRDQEKARQWCAKSRQLLELLKMETGMNFDELYRAEPDDNHNIMVVIDKNLGVEQAQAREGTLNAVR